MVNQLEGISDSKFVLKAAQAVWAANKYFILACDQEAYRQVRQALKPSNLQLVFAYDILERVETNYHAIPSHELPQISNALYHMAGYFKRIWSSDQRQRFASLIKINPEQALTVIAEQSKINEVTYLLTTRLWKSERNKPFNNIPIPLKHKRYVYQANQLLWEKEKVYTTKK